MCACNIFYVMNVQTDNLNFFNVTSENHKSERKKRTSKKCKGKLIFDLSTDRFCSKDATVENETR